MDFTHPDSFSALLTNSIYIYIRIGNGYISLVFVIKFKIFISLKVKAKISSTFYSWQSQRNSIPNTLIHIHIFIMPRVSAHGEISFKFLKVDHKVVLYTLKHHCPITQFCIYSEDMTLFYSVTCSFLLQKRPTHILDPFYFCKGRLCGWLGYKDTLCKSRSLENNKSHYNILQLHVLWFQCHRQYLVENLNRRYSQQCLFMLHVLRQKWVVVEFF